MLAAEIKRRRAAEVVLERLPTRELLAALAAT
jgi:hypothetical protein